jgi:6-phosphofructokinase
MVSEGISLRGHSGKPADMISRELSRAGISNRTAFPEHTQRAGDTVAADRILAARMADCALEAIENHETFMMVSKNGREVKTVPIAESFAAGDVVADPNVPDMFVSNSYVSDDDPLLSIAHSAGIYIGEEK